MSYNDDEELKIGDMSEEDDADLDLGADLDDPLLDDGILPDEDEDTEEGFAGIDGAEY